MIWTGILYPWHYLPHFGNGLKAGCNSFDCVQVGRSMNTASASLPWDSQKLMLTCSTLHVTYSIVEIFLPVRFVLVNLNRLKL